MQSKSKKVWERMAIGAIAPFAAIAIGIEGAIAQTSSPDSAASPPPVTKVLPNDAAGVFLINTSEKNWGAINRFNPFPFALTGPGGLPFLPPQINFALDVQPWLGEWAAIALLPPKNTANSESLPPAHILMLAPAKDTAKLDAFIAKWKETRPEAPIEQEYKGIKILEWPAEEPPPVEELPETEPDSEPNLEENPQQELPSEELPETEPNLEENPQQELPPTETLPSPTPQSQSSEPTLAYPNFALALQRFSFLPSPLPQLRAAKSEPADTLEPSEPETPEEFSAPTTEGKPGLAIAALPGYLAVSTSSSAIEQLIDSQTDINPLAETPKFQRTLQHPEFERSLFVGYGNLAAVAQLNLSGNFPDIPGGFPIPLPSLELIAEVLKTLADTYDSAEVLTWVQAEGIRSQSSVYYKTPQPKNASSLTPDADSILAKLPATTYLSFNSRNFKKQWEQVVKIYSQNEGGTSLLDLLRQFVQNNLGLDLERDIISWMDGEYCLFFFPTTDGLFPYILPQLKIGMGLMVQTSDRAKAEQTANKIDELVKTSSKGIVTVTREPQEAIVNWEIEQSGRNSLQSIVAHGWTDDNTLIFTTGRGAMSALNPPSDRSLTRFYTFQTAIAPLPRPNDGYFYLNWGASLSFIYTFVPLDDSSEFVRVGKRFAGTLRSISFSTLSTPEKDQTDALIVLAPASQP